MDFERHATLLFCVKSANVRGTGAEEKEEREMEKKKAGVRKLRSLSYLKSILGIDEVKGALYSLFHYTNAESFGKIVSGNAIWLSRIDQMNDLTEVFPDADKTYAFCLTAVSPETVAMWIGYGLPRKKAIRVRFSGKELKSICGQVTVYPVEDNAINKRKPIQGTASLQYVGYMSRLGKRVYVRDSIYKIPDKEFNLMEKFGSFIKRLGWKYEQEIRLVVKLTERISANKVQLDCANVIKALLTYNPKKRKDSKGMPSVIVGPWGSREDFIKEITGKLSVDNGNVSYFLNHSNDNEGLVRESEYKGKIRLGQCDKCEKTTSCDCCYHE
jgi:hypothetical protein